jgi:hypothetical protein
VPRPPIVLFPLLAASIALALGAGCGSELGGRDTAPHDDADLVIPPDAEVEPDLGPDTPDPDVAEVADVLDVADLADLADGDATEDADLSSDDGDVPMDDVDPDAAPVDPCVALADDAPCDDHNACTLGDRCYGGRCLPTEALRCEDGNVCTDDTCDPASGCAFRSNLASCDDGDPCTTADRCAAGICRPGGATCDDRNPCTRDLCGAGGACQNLPDDTLPCEDGSACTAGDFCAGGVCLGGLVDGCGQGDACASVGCAADGLTCKVVLLDGMGCDDGNACTSGDRCSGGLCRSGGALRCPWDSECAAYHCDTTVGCILDTSYPSGKVCSDDDVCTTGETCDGQGGCIPAEPAACDDDNPCTSDSCDGIWGCQHLWTAGDCDDDNVCTTDDACVSGQCRGADLDCDDQNACTADSCDPRLGCQHTPIGCDDGNPCTSDACIAGLGCRHVPNDLAACSDGLACTIGDRCAGGVCVGTSTCGDGDPCTIDRCDAEEGCTNLPLSPCPVGALSVSAIGASVAGSPVGPGVGQWIAIRNDGTHAFDLDGYFIRSEACDCLAPIDESVIVQPGGLVYGLRASSPPPAVIAPGGPASAGAFDFEFGVAGDGFRIEPAGDRVELIGPGGEVVSGFAFEP